MKSSTLTPEQRRERVQAAHDRLSEAISSLTSSGDWVAWLAASRRFHDYSSSNVFLILSQRPEATQVAGYRTWQSLGRQVKKGAKGIAVLAPMTRKIDEESRESRESREARETREPGESGTLRLVRGFRVVYVFDVDDTEGDELATPPARPSLLEGEAPEGMWDYLEGEVGRAGFHVELVPNIIGSPGANGITYVDGSGRILVATDGRSSASQVRTLSHELAHALLHAQERGDRALAEVEAESVAFLVCDSFGLDGMSYSMGYVAHWAASSEPGAVLATASRIRDCATSILARTSSGADDAEAVA